MLAVQAEFERELISERTKAALAAAKKRGVKLGCPVPEHGSAAGVKVRYEHADQFAANTRPVIDSIRDSGVSSLRGIAEALNARGIQAPRGGEWHPTAVARVLGRTG